MSSLDRRTLIAGVVGAASLPRLARAAAPPSGKLTFNIFRDGRPFGQYLMTFVKMGDGLKVTTEAAMAFRLAGITTFDYKHHCEEIWQGGQFVELHSRSVRDGRVTDTVSAIRGAYEITVNTDKNNFIVPASANPLTHWNPASLNGKLFNPQDGKRLEFTIRNIGRDAFPLANRTQITADHWMLRGDQQIDEWYDDTGVWAGLRAVFPDKSIIEYHRV